MILYGLLFVAALLSTSAQARSASQTCGYQSCPALKDGYVNVHLVPHTHDDVGWLKTVDQYYYGSRSKTQLAGVQYILDSVIEALKVDPSRRFIYVETSFFWKWWMKQHDIVRHQVKRLVNNGQLEFIGGGWSMNDEADTNYQSIIDQFTWGLRKLNETFGECGRPKIGWQIDPFGHSRQMASIFALMGFDGLLLGRIDYQDKAFRFKTKSPEMVWEGDSVLGVESQIFTGVMYNTYSPPPGFCFDVLCVDDPLIDDKKSTEYNIDKKVDDFLAYAKNVTSVYNTNNIIITMGEDFNYQDARMWFMNLDKLIKYTNARQTGGSKYNLIYSTPSCYVKAVQDEALTKGTKWMLKTDDFFPYASDPHAYWTGYFSSRPTLKRFERVGNNYLQVCKQLYALTDLGPEDRVDLNAMREAMGIMQHHDAVTGTEKEHVAHDYARILSNGIAECDIITATALSKLMTNSTEEEEPNNEEEGEEDPQPAIAFESCLLTNMSQCQFTEEAKTFVVTVYNPLSRNVAKYVRLPVSGKSYSVKDGDGKELHAELIPIHDAILKMPGRESSAVNELIFYADEIPPLGYKSYYVGVGDSNKVVDQMSATDHQLGNAGFSIDSNTGLISQLTINGINLPISQDLLYYKGYVGDNKKFTNRSSGAYIFRPLEQDALQISPKAEFKIYRGQLVAEVQQTFNEWASQTIRVYHAENFIEFDWIVGPIPDGDTYGKEIISRFKTQMNSEKMFFTDSNGRQTLLRTRNSRPSWNLDLQEPVAGNYYPVNSYIAIRDTTQNIELAVLTDRAQGGSSLRDGEIELMVHRLCMHDDAFGVDEALKERAYNSGLVARGSHYLTAGHIGMSVYNQERDIMNRKLLDSWIFLSPTSESSFHQYRAKYRMQFSGLTSPLPDTVQVMTLEPWIGFSFLLRLENVVGVSSVNAQVSLRNLFAPFTITSYQETTLGANQFLPDNNRLRFEAGDNIATLVNRSNLANDLQYMEARRKSLYDDLKLEKREVFTADTSDTIFLAAAQIRTFIIEVDFNK